MSDQGVLCLVHSDGSGTFLRPRPDAFAEVRDLDSARLEHALAAVTHEVRYQHGAANVLEAVRSGRADAGVLIRPVGIAEIRRTADEGLLMPPKSTFFTPKLRTGLVLRPLA
jgi:ABC-type amino acid transport substrate-binding protein